MQPMHRAPSVVVTSIPALAERFAARCTAAALEARAARGRFSLAVPGGSVAEHFLPALAAADIEWDPVDLFFVDERCVPPDSDDSNFAAVTKWFLDKLSTGPPRVHRMEGERDDLARAAWDYVDTLRFVLGTPPVLDVALLGVGEDGHVASLFPGHPTLRAGDSPVLIEDAAPKPPERRLTLSLEVFASAREVVVGAFGATKSAAVADVLQNPNSDLPLALLLRTASHTTLLIDEDAAGDIDRWEHGATSEA